TNGERQVRVGRQVARRQNPVSVGATAQRVQELTRGQRGKGQGVGLRTHAVATQAIAIGGKSSGRQYTGFEGNAPEVPPLGDRGRRVAGGLLQHIRLGWFEG